MGDAEQDMKAAQKPVVDLAAGDEHEQLIEESRKWEKAFKGACEEKNNMKHGLENTIKGLEQENRELRQRLRDTYQNSHESLVTAMRLLGEVSL